MLVQVYDLHDCRPADVLRCIWDNLRVTEESGDPRSAHFRASLRILAAGGDGTVAWLLGTVADLGLSPPPRVAVWARPHIRLYQIPSRHSPHFNFCHLGIRVQAKHQVMLVFNYVSTSTFSLLSSSLAA